MKKRIVSVLLSIVIISTMLTGCASKSMTTATCDEAVVYEEAPGEYVNKNSSTDCCDVAPAIEESANSYNYNSNNFATASINDSSVINGSNLKGEACEEWFDISDEYSQNIYNNEKYAHNDENDYTSVLTNPLSTFAADVDTASYSNLRRMILDGYNLDSIPVDAVRSEEMINYFKYNYKEPKSGDVFGVNAQVSTCPWNHNNLLMTVGINTAAMDSREIPDCNLVFLVDVSGSMSDSNKLPLIQKTMALLSDSFDSNDRISIVTYASGVDTILDGCKGNDSRKIIKAFESLSAGGSTNGGDGIKKAYKIAEKNFIKDGVNRVIICSDGDFNVGLTSSEELEELVTKKKDSGIFLSTLGFGMYNYSDTTMETLADKGNGNYAYIDDLTEAKRVLIDEMSSTFVTVAKDVKLQVEFNPAVVSEYRLIGYENRALDAKDFKDDSKDGGELGAGHQVTAVYELCTDVDATNNDLKYQTNAISDKGNMSDEFCTVSVAYKEPESDKSKYLAYPIGTDCFSKKPCDDYKLAAAVAMTSLALKDSTFLKDLSKEEALESSYKIANSLKNDYSDEYVSEFADMLDILLSYDNYFEW